MVLHGHKKSRNGCTRCKQRRVKCDEGKPCGNCSRRGEDCDLLQPRPNRHCASCIASAAASPVQSDGDLQLFTTSDWSRDMYLMHHYSVYTSSELSTTNLQPLLQHDVFKQAAKHPFLMHGLLAISALHLADKEPASAAEYLPLSIHHQNLAISSFRSALVAISEENCHAVFAQASVISMSSMFLACVRSRVDPHYEPSVDEFIEPYILTRGIGDVVATARDWIIKGPLAVMLDGHVLPNVEHTTIPYAVQSHFDNIRDKFRNSFQDEEELSALLDALASLEYICKELATGMKGSEDNPGLVWKWPFATSHSYTSRLRMHHPGALVLFAHFATLSRKYNSNWFHRGWSDLAVTTISNALSPEWRAFIKRIEIPQP